MGGSESFTVTKNTGTYNSKDVLTAATVTTSLVAGDFTPANGALASNYVLPTTASGAGHITAVTLTASITGNPTKPYDGNTNATLTSANFSLTPVVGSESFTVTKNTGTYNSKDVLTAATVTTSLVGGDFTPANGALASNYVLPTTASGAGHIKTLTVTVTPDAGQHKTYGAADPTLTYGFTPALISGDSFSGLLARDAGTNAGFYNITQGSLALSTNYTLAFTAGVKFEIKTLTVTVTSDAGQHKTYGAADPTLTYGFTPALISGDSFSGLLARDAGTNAGFYNITQGSLALSTNYTLAFTAGVQFEIKTLTVTVTPDAGQHKTYGAADPTLTYSFTPALISGDSFSGALARAAGPNVGTYSIQQGTLSAGANYNLTFVAASLQITARPITVTADAKTKMYGDAEPALTYQITSGSLAFSDAFTGALTRLTGENVGTYAIQQGTLALSSNYTLTFVGANLMITPALLTVTADNQTMILHGAVPTVTFKITGFKT